MEREPPGNVTSMGAARPIEIVPSVLPADLARLGDEVKALAEAGVDRIQWDVMDGHFVPNLTFGPDVIAACRPLVAVPFEAHLMVERPEDLLARYVEAGCGRVIVHVESTHHLHRTLGAIVDLGGEAGAALNPATPAASVANVLDLCSVVLVMTVNPGFGGQAYLATMEPKIRDVANMVSSGGHCCDVEVDGGIGNDTVAGAVAAGANVLVSGSALFAHPDGLAAAVKDLRTRAEAAA
jgi:ribulose-phosphate 3-epimerase